MHPVVPASLVVIAVVGVAYGLRRLLMWMGKRGWIYYGNSPGSIGAGALAAMEIASILEPEVEHVIEEIRSEKARGEIPGDSWGDGEFIV
ncbi:MAG: hypothetical protein HKN95_12395 [Acidimicrobiia bacterium]|nr:hypothetical protein [Acidimicrobiia bacterium]